MVEMTIEYVGGLRCEAVHGPSGNRLLTDAPVDNHGKGEAFSPTDLVATALGNCMLTVMGIYAQRHGIELRGARAVVSKEMASAPVRRIARIGVKVRLPLAMEHPEREALERTALSCPVFQSLHPEVEKAVEFFWEGSAA